MGKQMKFTTLSMQRVYPGLSCNQFVIYRPLKKLLESYSNIALGGDRNAQEIQ